GGMIAFTGQYTFSRCQFIENTTARLCGGLWINQAQATITDCTFTGNSGASGSGVTVCRGANATLGNCLFNRNVATTVDGSALYVLNRHVNGNDAPPASGAVVSCTFAQTEAAPDYAAVFVTQTSSATMNNCILWGNSPAQAANDVGTSLTI